MALSSTYIVSQSNDYDRSFYIQSSGYKEFIRVGFNKITCNVTIEFYGNGIYNIRDKNPSFTFQSLKDFEFFCIYVNYLADIINGTGEPIDEDKTSEFFLERFDGNIRSHFLVVNYDKRDTSQMIRIIKFFGFKTMLNYKFTWIIEIEPYNLSKIGEILYSYYEDIIELLESDENVVS